LRKVSAALLVLFFLTIICFQPAATCQMSSEDPQEGLVSGDFIESDIREILRRLAAQAGVRIISDRTVQGNLTIELKDVPLEDALRMVLSAGNYTFRKMPEGYYLVGLCNLDSPSFSQLSVTEYFRPNYLKSGELKSLVSAFYLPYLQVNEAANVITITASADMVKRIKDDLLKFDLPPRQIMIDAVIVELTEEGKKSLGVDWGPMHDGGFSVYPPSQPADPGSGEGAQRREAGLSGELLAGINKLIPLGQARVKANPHLTTLEGKQAEISVGREEYYLLNAGQANNAYYTLQSIATGVVLTITPYVDEQRQITVEISPEVSEVSGKGAAKLPIVTRRSAATSVRVNDGQTIAIGGLVEEQVEQKSSRFSKRKEAAGEHREMAIFITPYLLEGDRKAAPVKNDLPLAGEVSAGGQAGEEPVKQYYLQVHKIIEEGKKLPELETLLQGEPREVTVELTLFSTGRVHSARVLKTSGSAFLDMLATKSIEDLSPFPPFPDEIKGSSITFVVPLRYEE